jgi:hypothetical protein
VERLHPLHHPVEVVERQRLGVGDEQLPQLGELVAAARVGAHPRQLTPPTLIR